MRAVDPKKVAEALRLRAEGETLEIAAEMTGISRATIQRYEVEEQKRRAAGILRTVQKQRGSR